MQKSQNEEEPSALLGIESVPFELRAAAALSISVVADVLDYVASPVFALPIVETLQI